MKLAFSTKGWPGKSLNDFFHAAKMLGYAGVELHDGEKMAHPDGQNPLSKACAAPYSPCSRIISPNPCWAIISPHA